MAINSPLPCWSVFERTTRKHHALRLGFDIFNIKRNDLGTAQRTVNPIKRSALSRRFVGVSLA